MKIVYLGSGEFGIECLNALAESGHNLRFIITQAPHPAGRGRKPSPTPVASWANTHSVPFIETEDVNAPQVIEKVASFQPDLIVVIAFGQKIGKELINLPPFLLSQESTGAINVHASLLPKYRGAAPINWAIINGEKQTGISIITLAEKMDAGKILAQEKTDILENETAGELHDRLAQMAAPLLLKTIDKIADGSIVYTEQDHSKATLAPKLKKSDGFIDFNDSAGSLRRKILGLWPWPGASTTYLSKKTNKSIRVTIAIAEVVQTSNPTGLPAGTLDENLNIICGEDALKITKIKPDGSRLMDFKDFVNGQRTRPGDTFMKIEQ
ncbi:Methionyl-tRNA formyltransferase [subsurface metagenome]